MKWLLLLSVLSGYSGSSTVAANFSSKQTCEAAAKAHEQALKDLRWQSFKVVRTCSLTLTDDQVGPAQLEAGCGFGMKGESPLKTALAANGLFPAKHDASCMVGYRPALNFGMARRSPSKPGSKAATVGSSG
jgi:pantoate kinase